MLEFFKPAPAIDRMPEHKIDAEYKRYRMQVFMSIFIGYAAYYFIRKNFNMAVPYLIETYGYTKAQIGIVGSALGLSYGLSKFIMGNVSDRCNPRYFMAAGLILSGFVNMMFGYASSIPMLFILMFMNGWFQGMGWPPSGRTMTHWFSDKERGVKMAIWNVAHNVGGALVPRLALTGLAVFATWRGMFYFPATLSIAVGIGILIFLRDTPQSVGLPPIEEYKNDYPEHDVEDRERELSAKEILFKYVLCNKYIWYIAIANIFVYLVRYGVMDWIPTYLKEVKGFNIKEAGLAFELFEWAAIPGTIIVGWISDKIFHGRRAPMGVICMLGVIAAVFIYWKSDSMMAINIAVASVGALIYGPVMLIGVAALDYVPKKAAGTAAGFTGLFGYVGGAVLANAAVGAIVDKAGWDGGFKLIIAACFIAVFFLALTWNTHDRSEKSKEEAFSKA
ncbi:glycerol-3-phosphate transporter [Crassaminicella thermophila]|uniref:Glycerol-3-phosphate transporter n=1 Tax=Crassaminicella thermophila TaxID=2599308 RepID=A0A5C0S8P3_CRATE|nr:glycerol-3-phosphate transporter [Crassaminicella thermophila]QEK10903.1 glycerol-3-phosphate transporter [Crassaminicella thermophila]